MPVHMGSTSYDKWSVFSMPVQCVVHPKLDGLCVVPVHVGGTV